ncbi:MAG TPA: YhjD/YihY/BrkB family envelope integrity protein [Jatrophihabitans sp.]|jgi:membrane protein|nr:YhjD/YihY/BrkB family envelope integrity protein [Jatrophihabitans sp.]
MIAGGVTRAKDKASARWHALQQRHVSVRHVVAAWNLLKENNGGQYAAAITYFSFLALFPLLLLAVSITGFVLRAHPATEQSLYDHITENIPGDLGKTLQSSLQAAIDSRAGVGIIGLLGVLVTGLGWVGNLRTAINAVWGHAPAKISFIKAKLADLVLLASLGLAALISLGLTIVGTSLTDQILRAMGLDDLPGATALLKVVGIAIAVGGDVIIFWWLLVRLPGARVPGRIAMRGAVLAAVGFEVLKIVGTYTVAHTADSPTAGPFASIVAVLIWMQLVARWVLFACAWTATLTAEHRPPAQAASTAPEPAVAPDLP